MLNSIEIKKESFIELHTHLYGCLDAETLFDLGKKNTSPRWHLFVEDYERAFNEKIVTDNFFRKYSDIELFKKLYHFNSPSSFEKFQAKFNLIIALSKFDLDEIYLVSKNVLLQHIQQNVQFSEYRIMYSTLSNKSVVQEKTLAFCEGLKAGSIGGIGRAVVSLHRDKDPYEQYEWLRELMVRESIVSEYLVGIDFCNVEEGFPVEDKIDFFKTVLLDNQLEQHNALSILYHIGESFKDKTPQSTCRWIVLASEIGVHRLGHCIALGLPSKYFLNKKILELKIERIRFLNFILERYDSIRDFGEIKNKDQYFNDLTIAERLNSDCLIEFGIPEMKELDAIQNYTFSILKKHKTVVESCPTSNRWIGGIHNLEDLPTIRFVKEKIPLTIGSDDPGILDITLPYEYNLLAQIGIDRNILQEIQFQSKYYISEVLTGRKKITI